MVRRAGAKVNGKTDILLALAVVCWLRWVLLQAGGFVIAQTAERPMPFSDSSLP
jgi:hypothetical protein